MFLDTGQLAWKFRLRLRRPISPFFNPGRSLEGAVLVARQKVELQLGENRSLVTPATACTPFLNPVKALVVKSHCIAMKQTITSHGQRRRLGMIRSVFLRATPERTLKISLDTFLATDRDCLAGRS